MDTQLLFQILAAVLAAATAYLVDLLSRRRGLQPPGFAVAWRRAATLAAFAGLFYVGIFGPIASIGSGTSGPVELTSADVPYLFSMHALMLLVMVVWYVLGFVGVSPEAEPVLPEVARNPGADPGAPTSYASPAAQDAELDPSAGPSEAASPRTADDAPPGLAAAGQPAPTVSYSPFPAAAAPARESGWDRLGRQLGLVTHRPLEDIALGLGAGVVGWFGMVAVMMLVVAVMSLFGAEDSLPQQPPEVITFMVGLPWLVRLALGLSAGLFEEAFFRGLLQGRTGILFSSFLFIIAHSSYEQPFMLVGLTFLSLLMAGLVKWRQNIWPAVVAHAAFDLVQLLVVIPSVTKLLPTEMGGTGG